MSASEGFEFSRKDFCGKVRLFPLPDLVLFPHIMQPLHLFEPRYRELLEEATASDRLIAMATLAPGWETDYEGRPPLWPVACLGRVEVVHRLDDGSYNVLLGGVARVRVIEELSSAKPFREARAELCEDQYPSEGAASVARLHRRLREAFVHVLPGMAPAHEQMNQLLAGEVSLGMLTDVIGYLLEIDIAAKEALLTELNVYRRAEMILGHLARPLDEVDPYDFPPEFSLN